VADVDPDEIASDGVLNNPAARLLYWLEWGKDCAGVAAQDKLRNSHPGSRTEPFRVLDVWCQIWELDKDRRADRLEYHRRALGMIDAGVEVRRLVARSSNPMAGPALHHFTEIEAALDHFMGSPDHEIGTMMSKIEGTGWQSLRLLNSLLASEAPQPVLRPAQIADLLKQTNDLIAGVADSDLSEEDRLILVEKLEEVASALTRARVTGTTVVLNASDGLMGALMRLHIRGVDLMSNPVATAAFALVQALVLAVGLGADVTQIAGVPLPELLGLGGPGQATP